MVNPIASIEAIRMMLDHVGEEQAALDIQRAVVKTLTVGKVTKESIIEKTYLLKISPRPSLPKRGNSSLLSPTQPPAQKSLWLGESGL